MTPEEVMKLLEPVRLELRKHFRFIDIQPLQKLDLASGKAVEEVLIRLIK
jgi:predicted DNA-binding antitoxin AbrB/MazE fold protein